MSYIVNEDTLKIINAPKKSSTIDIIKDQKKTISDIEPSIIAIGDAHGNIAISDANGIIIKASTSNAAIYGIPLEEFVGASLKDLEAKGILNPSISLQVLRTGKEAQVMQVTHNGRPW